MKRNRDGSHATQANRHRMLQQVANQLHELGYKKMHASDLKGRHVQALVERWTREEIAPASIKNRMSALRWWAEKVGRSSVIARENAHYGIPDRTYVTNKSKAQTVSEEALSKVKDPFVAMSLELQSAFGLRREEAIKFVPSYADKGDLICLKASWTKGGREREIPIRNAKQREVLDRAHKLAGRGSLIPQSRTYIQHLKVYERHTANAGLSKMHGLRHEYAQTRYQEITDELAKERGLSSGWSAPAAGGPEKKKLSALQKSIDLDARAKVSLELGHERTQITSVYLGS